jgi:tetratricopeptide (TPR) repeat protein
VRDYEKALPYFKEMLKVSPENEAVLYHLGMCYLRIGQSTDAIKALRKAIKLNPEDKRAQSLLDFIASTPEI